MVKPYFKKDLWGLKNLKHLLNDEAFLFQYARHFAEPNPRWLKIPSRAKSLSYILAFIIYYMSIFQNL